MAIEYRGPSVPGGEVSPGTGTTGFTSRGIPFANASGQLVTNSSGPSWDSTANTLIFPNSTGVKVQFASSVFFQSVGTDQMLTNSQPNGSLTLAIGGISKLSAQSSRVTVGTSNSAAVLSLPSTVNMTSAVGAAGAAGALPATPESYIKVMAPNNAGTLTTLYLPLYLSTG